VCREAAVNRHAERHPQPYPIVKLVPELTVPFELETNPDGTQTALLRHGCIRVEQFADLVNELARQRQLDNDAAISRALHAAGIPAQDGDDLGSLVPRLRDTPRHDQHRATDTGSPPHPTSGTSADELECSPCQV
jgi:hypothetical protein